MPVIPRSPGPRVASTPEPSRQRPLAAYDGADSRGAQAVAGAVTQVAGVIERERVRLDEIRANEQEAGLLADVNTLWSDPKDGFTAKRGTDAVTGLDGFRDRLRLAISKRESTLSTDRQRALFRRSADRVQRELDGRAMAYVSDEVRRVDQQSHEALVAADRDAIAKAARVGDSAAVDARVAQLSERISLYGDRTGAAPEAIQRAREEAVSNARLVQIAGLADADPDRAAEALATHKDRLTAKDYEAARELVEQGSLTLRSQRERDRILAAHPDDERAALSAARALEGELEDRTVQRVTAHFAERRRLRQEEDRTFSGAVAATVEQTGSVDGLTAQQVARAKAIPGLWRSLTMRAKQVASGENAVTDWAWYEKYVNLSDDELRAANPAEYRPHLSDSDYKAFLDRKATVQGTGGRGQRDRGLTPSEVFSETLAMARRSGLVAEQVRTAADLNKNTGAKATFLRLHDAINADLSTAIEQKGAPLTEAETRTVIQAVFDDAVMRTAGFNKVVPRASLAEGAGFRELTDRERAERAPVRSLPPARAGESRRDRYLTLIDAGLTEAEAEAQVRAERPTP